MEAQSLHSWRVSYREAVAIQESCRAQVRIEPLAQPVRLVVGADVAYSRRSHRMYAAVVLVRLPSLEVVELAEWYGRATFPCIPGLLTFREIPPLLEVFRRLRMQPDALLFDGHGLAHPRRFGLACHGGLLFDRPSVGCAKSRLVGEHGKVGAERGSSAVEFVLARTRRFRIPEPIRLAHHATTALRRAHDADALPVAVRDYPWFVRKTHSGLRAEE